MLNIILTCALVSTVFSFMVVFAEGYSKEREELEIIIFLKKIFWMSLIILIASSILYWKQP